MIRVTRLNDKEMVINAEMIEFVEATPDTLISPKSGKKIMVMEPVDDVIELVVEYKRSCAQTIFGSVR